MPKHNSTSTGRTDPSSRITLDSFLDGPMKLEQFLPLAIGIARGLNEFHKKNTIHRSINPGNISINPKTLQVEISAILKVPPPPTEEAFIYISPEQTGRMNRTVDYRSDLYSTGVVYYLMLTGRLPFDAVDPLEWVHSHIARLPTPPIEIIADIPAMMSEIIMKLLSKTAEDRYQTAYGLKHDLEKCLSQWQSKGTINLFTPGEKDISDRLLFHKKLYGRQEEYTILLDALNRVCEKGNTEIVMVAGYSGIGKTSLVHEIYGTVINRNGYFISGKFDQYKRDIPYSTIIKAFSELILQILTESTKQVSEWKEKLLEALSVNSQVIIDIIPQLELIIGPQPPVPEVGPTESQNRFKFVLRNFVEVFCRKGRPLVIFFDDLHLIDPASLTFIKTMVSDVGIRHLMIIGAYRDNEVYDSHPLKLFIDEQNESGMAIHTITLGPLSRELVKQLVSDTLRHDLDYVKKLTEVILGKTGGNPFFIHQLLSAIYKEGLLFFDSEHASWSWDLKGIRKMPVSDNVVDLVVSEFQVMPASTQKGLSLAACIGNRFTLRDLATVSERDEEEIYADFFSSIQAGLLIPTTEMGQYRVAESGNKNKSMELAFLHDRVQQAAMSMLGLEEKRDMHLRIGRHFLKSFTEDERAERIFELADHFNAGLPLISDPREILKIARLNLSAAQKAKQATAWNAAGRYAAKAMDLLPPNPWKFEHPLAFEIFKERAECEFLTGNHDFADNLFQEAIQHSLNNIDKAQIYNLRLKLYQVAGRYAEGALLGQEALRLFEVDLPLEEEGNKKATDAELAIIRQYFSQHPIESILDLPMAEDPTVKAIMSLLANTNPCVYIGMPGPMFFLVTLKMISTSLAHGNTVESCFGYSCYGFLLIPAFDDSKSAYEFSEMAIRLNEKINDRTLRGTLLHLHGDHFNYWTNHISTGFPWLEKGFTACREVGDLTYASYIAFEIVWQAFERGDSPGQVITFSEQYASFARQINNEAVYETIRMQQKFMLCLKGWTDSPTTLDDSQFKESECLAKLTELSFGCGIEFYHVAKLILHYMYGEYNTARKEAEAAGEMLNSIFAMPAEASYYFYYALTLAAVYPESSEEDQGQIMEQLVHIEKKIGLWAAHCPDNFLHKHLLLQAEMARITSHTWDAVNLYDQSIDSARNYNYIQYEALANELAGRFMLSVDKRDFACLYLHKAVHCYSLWGADAKEKDLRERYKDIIEDSDTAKAITSDQLDLASAMKASQAISSQIIPENFLKTLVKIVIENAGAERGVILLEKEKQLVVEAEGAGGKKGIAVLQSIPVEKRRDLPNSILNYVRRTQESVVLDNAPEEEKFSADHYIIERKPKSILCMPILKKKELLGIVYLENNLATKAFTSHRLRVLEILCSQAAISIENAELYNNLEETIKELKQTEMALITSEEKLKAIIDNTTSVIYLKDKEGKYLLVNRQYSNLFHVNREDITGKTDHDFFPSEMADAFRRNDLIVLEKNAPVEFEEQVPHDDGIHFYISVKFPLKDDNGNPHAVCGISTDITERKRTEEQIKASLEEKEMLLREIHHRVKNNMQIISSLLKLQSDYVFDERDLGMFNESCARIRSMALIHEKLYQTKSGDMANINFDEYLKDIVNDLVRTYSVKQIVSVKIEAENIKLGLDTAIPCGLLVNEIVTNSLKHAFPHEEDGEISISLSELENNKLKMVVSDNGIGMPDNIDLKSSKTLGLQLISLLAERQLRGTLEFNGSSGTKYSVVFNRRISEQAKTSSVTHKK